MGSNFAVFAGESRSACVKVIQLLSLMLIARATNMQVGIPVLAYHDIKGERT